MKVVLASAPRKNIEIEDKDAYPPFSLGYIAAVLMKEGHEVIVIDSPAYHYTVEEASKKIIEANPEAVGVTVTTFDRFQAIDLCNKVREKTNALIFVGGMHFSPTARDALQNVSSIGVVVKREGEDTAKELLKVYARGEEFKKVSGIVYRDRDGNIIETPDRPYIHDLDAIPMPAWHLFPLKNYGGQLEGTKSINILTSRGCPNDCVFCASGHHWNRVFRRRSPKKVIDEIEFLHRQHGYGAFHIMDDTLTMVKEHVTQICEEIIKRNLDIVWRASARVNTVDKDTLKLMRKAGCTHIAFGVESGSQAILNNIRKGITIPQVKTAFKMAAELGFKIKADFMFGLPGETIEDVKKTMKLLDELLSYSPNVGFGSSFVTYIFPGTYLEVLAKKQGTIPLDFSWNRPCFFPRNESFGVDGTIPLYEEAALPLETLRKTILNEQYSLSRLVTRGFRRLMRVRDLNSLGKFANGTKTVLGNKIQRRIR